MSDETWDRVCDAFDSACDTLEVSAIERDAHYAKRLRSRGYLILAPGDTSPLAQLVRAAVAYSDSNGEWGWRGVLTVRADAVAADPAVREWVKDPAQDVGEVSRG